MDYEKLLDNVYANLPNKTASGERFEYPVFEFFVEGNKTIIKNFGVVCDKLRRDPEEVTKYFSKELAVPAENQKERMVLHRKIIGDMINKKLSEFITRYVICKECKKPDTKIVDVGHGLKQLVCEACGARNAIR
ncbi:MAG: translation initiation factor IF-2 subunit beta [Candidatus Micrarchaeota archaeon]